MCDMMKELNKTKQNLKKKHHNKENHPTQQNKPTKHMNKTQHNNNNKNKPQNKQTKIRGTWEVPNCKTVHQFSVHCISNISMMFLKLLTQSKHWQLSYMEAYYTWWTFSFLKSWQIQVLSQENLVRATILHWPYRRNYTSCISQD